MNWLGLTLLVCSVIVLRTSCEPTSNETDCRERLGGACSDYALVGECNQTTGVCDCDVYNTTQNIECFLRDPSNNFCQVRDCWSFFNGSGRCRDDSRKRTTALLLSIFLINFGAANFYIERFDLAVPQILIGLLLCFFQFGSCAVAAKRDDNNSILCISCCSINSFLSLLIFSWWIADLVIFATNSRDDGDGCPLST